MNKSDRAVALARIQQWITGGLLVAPADLALYVALGGINDAAVDFDGLFREVITANPVLLLLITSALALFKGGRA